MAWRDIEKRRAYKREWMRRYRAGHPAYVEWKRQYRTANLDKRREYNKRWYHGNYERARTAANRRYARLRQDAEWRKREKIWRAKYKHSHPKKDREYYLKIKAQPEKYARLLGRIKSWNRANKAKARAWRKRWDTEHPENRRARNRKRRALQAAAEGMHELSQWLARVDLYGWRCFYCRCALSVKTLTMDHRIPLSRGGSQWPANLVPACKSCNSGKRDRTGHFKKGGGYSASLPRTAD